MFALLTKIIDKVSDIKTKMEKLEYYWTKYQSYSITCSNVHSNCTMNTSSCQVIIQGNILHVQVSHKVTASISSGTSLKRKVCTISFTDTEHLLDWTQLPKNMNGLNGAAGGIITYAIYDWTTNGSGTYSASIMLCGTAAAAMNTSSNYVPRFICVVPRNTGITYGTESTFNIFYDGALHNHSFIEGMTWGDFVTSTKYNTIGLYEKSGYICYGSDTDRLILSPSSTNQWQSWDDVISSTAYLIISS